MNECSFNSCIVLSKKNILITQFAESGVSVKTRIRNVIIALNSC